MAQVPKCEAPRPPAGRRHGMRCALKIKLLLVPQIVCMIAMLPIAANSQAEQKETTTICSVLNNPEQFNGMKITLRGRVQSSWEYGAQIWDETCGNSGIHLFLHKENKDVQELFSMIDSGPPQNRGDTTGKVIHGTFTGVFYFKAPNRRDRSLDVQRVENLVLAPAKPTASNSSNK